MTNQNPNNPEKKIPQRQEEIGNGNNPRKNREDKSQPDDQRQGSRTRE